jgi:serine/threonine protein phosphatase PrpC
LKDIKSYSAAEDNQPSLFGRPESDNLALHTGCTACVALITDTEIYCANAGDSRCVLSVDGKAIEMSIDHKPEMASERARIEKAGGFVEENRVKGVLNLSRSLGDLEYKQDTSIPVENQMITCVPEIKIEKRSSKEEFIVIACDGIWDCLTSAECATICRDFLNGSQPKDNLSVCLEQMFDKIVASDVASSGIQN